MEPIISPWLLWLISFLHNLQGLCILFAVVFGVFAFIFGIDVNKNKEVIRPAIAFFVAFIICVVIAVCIPDEKTMLAMLTLYYITPDNLSLLQDNIIDFIQKIVDIYKGV